MKRIIGFIILVTSFGCSAVFAQVTSASKHEVRGVMRTQDHSVVPGIRMKFKSDADEIIQFTDINGEFHALLPDGDFLVTSDSVNIEDFRAFITVGKKLLDPNYLEFSFDSEKLVCSGNRGDVSPKVLSTIVPPYPAAARAVRAGGEATVYLRIKQDGTVSSVEAKSGHPLLRRASEVASEKFVFEKSNETEERQVLITFVFLPNQVEKPGLQRILCPYRIAIAGKEETIDTISY